MANKTSRVNGRSGESMWATEDELCFRTNNKVQHMPLASLRSLDIMNTEEARELVASTELVPYGAWTEEMKSSAGKTLYLTATSEESCWVMEVNKSQAPNASDFQRALRPGIEDNLREEPPKRAIETPLGGVFVIGEIACIFGAIFVLYTLEQPIIALVLLGAAALMFFKAR